MRSQENRRTQRRRPLFLYLSATDHATGAPVGRVADLTRGGLLLLVEGGLAEGRTLDLDLHVPDVAGAGPRRVHLRATVRWVAGDRNPSLRCAGCEFEPMSVEVREIIDELVALLAFQGAAA